MQKTKSRFICQECTYTTLKWIGCCPECKQWDTFAEQKSESQITAGKRSTENTIELVTLNTIKSTPKQRMKTQVNEWDRVVGGGIMPGSFLTLTGDPGVGKSTLLLQISYHLAQQHTIFYISTEESLEQVRNRAQRLGCLSENLLFSDNNDLLSIVATAQKHKPKVLIIDSIQNCYITGASTQPGSVSQLRESAFALMRLAKENEIAVIISGHITKDGHIAGPKTLEHMVDAVFYLQGEDRWQTRVLRSVKNRFGTINEIGFFTMEQNGLQELPNINEHLLSEINHCPGSALVSVREGSRTLLLELQALVIETKLTIPQRVISGVDHKQVVLIAAILEKYLHVRFSAHDIFFKISGGFKTKDSATDLGIALALLSSYFQQPLPEKSIGIGEISVTGQIKPINHINQYTKEAEKFGIKQLLVAKKQKVEKTKCKTLKYQSVYELLSLFNS